MVITLSMNRHIFDISLYMTILSFGNMGYLLSIPLSYSNSISLNIQFCVEIELDKSINFTETRPTQTIIFMPILVTTLPKNKVSLRLLSLVPLKYFIPNFYPRKKCTNSKISKLMDTQPLKFINLSKLLLTLNPTPLLHPCM